MIRLEQKLGVQGQGPTLTEDRRNMVLEDKVLELEQALAKEKKKNSALKNAKDIVFLIEFEYISI